MRYSVSLPAFMAESAVPQRIQAIPVWNTVPEPVVTPPDPIAAIRQCLQQLPQQQLTVALELAGELLQASGLRLYIPNADPTYQQSTYHIGPQPERLGDDGHDRAAIGDARLVEQHLLWQQFLESGRHNQTGDQELSSPDTWVINHLSYEFRLRTLARAFQASHIEHIMVLPLRHDGRLVGSLSLFRDRDCPVWALPQIALAQTLGKELAQAIAQHRQISEVHQLQQRLSQCTHELAQLRTNQTVLSTVVSLIRKATPLETIFATTVTEIYQQFQADRVVVYRFEPDGRGELIAEVMGDQWTPLMIATLDPDDDLNPNRWGSDARSGQVKVVDDIAIADWSDNTLNRLEPDQCRTYMMAPLYQDEQLWGCLAVYQNTAPRSWESTEIALMEQISAQLGIAIQQAAWRDTARSQAADLAATMAMLTQTQMPQTEALYRFEPLTAAFVQEVPHPDTVIQPDDSPLPCEFEPVMIEPS